MDARSPHVQPDGLAIELPLANKDTTCTDASHVKDVDIDPNINLKSIRRKIDWHIVPLMFLCYTMQFLDKVSLNYARVMGLNKDVNLQGNDFSNIATAFFVAYLIAEIPTGYILNKVPAAKYLGVSVILWGIATACTAAARGTGSLLAARIFLGIFEAAIAPCLALVSSQWYTKSEQAPRFSFWLCGIGAGQILGGIISYGFQKVTHANLASWRIMFLFLGALTVTIGASVLLWLPTSLTDAKFLTPEEKAAVMQHIEKNKTGTTSTEVKISQIYEALLDIQFWLLALITVLSSISSGVVTTFSAILISNIGYKPDAAALLNMPSGIVSIIASLAVGLSVRYTKSGHRWFWIAMSSVPGIIGGALMSFLPSHPPRVNKPGILAGIYLINSTVAALAIIFQWAASNIAGHTKRAFGISLIAGAFSIGNIIGPQTFQDRDAPQYIPAKITVLATQAGCALSAFLLFLHYRFANSRKEKALLRAPVDGDLGQQDNLTDKENPTFRYVY